MFLKSVAFVERNLDMTDKDKQVREELAKKLCGLVCGKYGDPYKRIALYILKHYVPRKRRRVGR